MFHIWCTEELWQKAGQEAVTTQITEEDVGLDRTDPPEASIQFVRF